MNALAHARLVAWLMTYFAAHATPPPPCAHPDACTSDELAAQEETMVARGVVVGGILDAAYDPAEAPLFTGAYARARTSLRLAATGAHESGIKPHLVRGECWKGECPGGSVGELQLVIPAGGIVMAGDWLRPCTAVDEHCVQPADVVADHVLADRVALRIFRWGGLRGYTGQPDDGPAPTWIVRTSVAFLHGHPVPVKDAEAMGD